MNTPAEHMRALLSTVSASALTATAVPDAILAGQLWRARWADTTTLVLAVADADAGYVCVAAVTIGVTVPQPTDAAVVELSGEVVRRAVVWETVRDFLPLRTLDALLEYSPATNAVAAQVRHDRERGPLDPFDPAAELLAELEDDLAELAAVSGLPVAVRDRPPAKLSDALPGDTYRKLAGVQQALGISQADAMDLLRAVPALTDQQATSVESYFELPPGALPRGAVAFPAELRDELDHPRWRSAVLSRVTPEKPELMVRCEVATDACALAARESTPTPHWRERLAMVLGTHSP